MDFLVKFGPFGIFKAYNSVFFIIQTLIKTFFILGPHYLDIKTWPDKLAKCLELST